MFLDGALTAGEPVFQFFFMVLGTIRLLRSAKLWGPGQKGDHCVL